MQEGKQLLFGISKGPKRAKRGGTIAWGGEQISQGEGSLSSDFKRDQKIIKGASGRQQGLVL